MTRLATDDDEAARRRSQEAELLRQSGQELAEEAKRQDAVKIVQANIAQEVKRAGGSLSDANMEQIAERTRERFDRDPQEVDRVLDWHASEQQRRRDARESGREAIRETAEDARRERLSIREEISLRIQQKQQDDEQELERQRGGR
jgi:hypothetical protein